MLDISHNQIKSAKNLSLLKSLRDLNISFNLLKSQEEFCAEISALKELIKIDTRKNVYNSIPSSEAEMNDYRVSIIRSLPNNLVNLDGETVRDYERDCERDCESKRLFKLTDTFDSEVFKNITETAGERLFRNMTNRTNESHNRESDRENKAPNFEIGITDNEITVGKIREKFINNIQEFDEALNRLKQETKLPQELSISNIVPCDYNKPQDETIELAHALDVTKIEDKSIMKRRGRNIADELRKVFKEELDSLRSDLKGKIDKYKESKSVSMRYGDITLCSNQEKSIESKRVINSITKRCEDNEKELKRMQSKMKKLAKRIQEDKESEYAQKKELNRSISALKQKIESIEIHNRSLSIGNASTSHKRRAVLGVSIPTESEDNMKKTLKNVFIKYAKENKVYMENINFFISHLSSELQKYKSKKDVQSTILRVTKKMKENGYIDFNIFMNLLNFNTASSCTSLKSTPCSRQSCEKIETKERKYMKRLHKVIFKEPAKVIDSVVGKLFFLSKCKVKAIYEIIMNKTMKDFFYYKIHNKQAKILFYTGNYYNQPITKENIKEIYSQDLTFTASLSVALRNKRRVQNTILMMVVLLGKMATEDMKEADTLYDSSRRLYLLKNQSQVYPLFIIDYY